MPASRCFSAARHRGDVAVPQHLGGAGGRADHLVGLLGLALGAVLERQLGDGRLGAGAAGRGRGSPSRALKNASKTWSKRARSSGLGAQRGAAGDAYGARRRRRRAARPRPGSRAARSWVTGTPPARSARAKASRISSPPRTASVARSVGRARRDRGLMRAAAGPGRASRGRSPRGTSPGPRGCGAADSRSRSAVPRWCRARAQSMVSATPGGFCRSRPRSCWTTADDLAGERLGDLGGPRAHDLELALEARVLDPVVEAAPLERVVELAGAVGGEDDDGRDRGLHGAELRDRAPARSRAPRAGTPRTRRRRGRPRRPAAAPGSAGGRPAPVARAGTARRTGSSRPPRQSATAPPASSARRCRIWRGKSQS